MNDATTEYTSPDELLILKAGQELELMINTSGYSPIECLRRVFLPVLEQVRTDVKAACPAIPPTPTGDFTAKSGISELELSFIKDGSLAVEAYNRDEQVILYLEPDDIARLRGWLSADRKPGHVLAPRELLVSLDSLLSWIAHRGWTVGLDEDREKITQHFIPKLREITQVTESSEASHNPNAEQVANVSP